MIYIETNTFEPHMNLAYEEYFLKKKDFNEPVLMLWQNKPTIVIGRFQNMMEEINEAYIKENNISVVRRMTGGGAVYHDYGNLCYSFIVRGVKSDEADFTIFARPIIKALKEIGVIAEISGRNDLTVGGSKVSGTAMSLFKDSLLFHGTLLYNSDLSMLSKALQVSPEKFVSKSCKSIRSRVTNIKEYLKNENDDISVFKNILKEQLEREFNFLEYPVGEEELKEIKKLSNEKYLSWDFTFGNNPKCQFKNRKKYAGGILEVHMDIDKQKIQKCFFRGDFLGLSSLLELETAIIGIKYEKTEVIRLLKTIDIKKYFNGISIEEIVDCMFLES